MLCAISVRYGRIKQDLSCMKSDSCLLATPSVFMDASNTVFASLSGAYLIVNTNDYTIVRIGKTLHICSQFYFFEFLNFQK